MSGRKFSYKRAPIKTLPSVEYLQKCFSYDQETGELRWKLKPHAGFCAGKVAGAVGSGGYLTVGLDGKYYRVHRIIFKMMTGEEPLQVVDHIDGDLLNNRLSNLRIATFSESTRNRGMSKNNTTGYRGVYLIRGQYMAKINRNGKLVFLGNFATAQAASAVYNAVARALYGKFYREL